MKSQWKVTTNMVGVTKAYQVYRLYDIQKTDHSGNREEDPYFYKSKDDAIKRCRELNQLEEHRR